MGESPPWKPTALGTGVLKRYDKGAQEVYLWKVKGAKAEGPTCKSCDMQ